MKTPITAGMVRAPQLARDLPIILLLIFGSEQVAAAELSGDEALKLMKANDAQFDNVLVEYDYTKYEQIRRMPKRVIETELQVDESIDPSTLPSERELLELISTYILYDTDRPPGPVPEDKQKWVRLILEGKITWRVIHSPQPAPKIETKKTTSRYQMGLRWPELAVLKIYGPRRWGKFSAIGERISLLYAVSCGSPETRDWFLSTDTVTYFPNPYQRAGLWPQFALGIGYSRIISDVTSFEKKGDSYHMQVEIDWFSHMTGKGTLVLDESLVVRSADINYGPIRLIASTEGLHRASDGRQFVCAQKGRFEKFRISNQRRKFDVSLKSIQFNMTDAQFEKLKDMSSPLDEPRYEYDDMGSVRTVRDPRRATPALPVTAPKPSE